jgi:hypothetical protein
MNKWSMYEGFGECKSFVKLSMKLFEALERNKSLLDLFWLDLVASNDFAIAKTLKIPFFFLDQNRLKL